MENLQQNEIDPSIPYDLVELPSKGIFYKNRKKTLKISYLTAADENILTSPNLSESGELMDTLLKAKILDNELHAGQQMIEAEVSELLNMSRTPTREAMLRIANEGLIELKPRHGMRIKPISVIDMQEIYEILTGIEATAAALCAKKGLRSAILDARCGRRDGPSFTTRRLKTMGSL